MPNPCCGPVGPGVPMAAGPRLLPPMLFPPVNCVAPVAAYQPVSMSRPQRLRPQRMNARALRQQRCAVPDYYPPVPQQRYIPVRPKRSTIKEVFKDRVVWGKPTWKKNKYPGVVQDKVKQCQCAKCRAKRASSCRHCSKCREGTCAVPSHVWAADCDDCTDEYVLQQPYDICGEGCDQYSMLTSTPTDASVSSDESSEQDREFHASGSQQTKRIPPPAPVPPPEEGDTSDEESPVPIEPPPVDMSDPDMPPMPTDDGVQQMSLEVPFLDFTESRRSRTGSEKADMETFTMQPTSVTRRRIQ